MHILRFMIKSAQLRMSVKVLWARLSRLPRLQKSVGQGVRLALLAVLVMLLAACGPESGSGAEAVDQEGEALRIAAEYGQSGDIARARIELQAIEVANPSHWLLFLTEEYIAQGTDPGGTQALVQLTLGLGLQSRTVSEYARQHNLLTAAPEPTFEVVQPSASNVIALQPAPRSADAASASNEASVEVAPPVEVQNDGDTAELETEVVTEAVEAVQEAAPVAPVEATPAPPPNPMIQATNALNVRGGPGTDYPVVSAMQTGAQANIVARNPQSDWWQVTLANGQQGWVYSPLVTTSGDTTGIAVAANIPAPPPTPVPAPVVEAPAVVEAPPAEEPAPVAEAPPAEEAPQEEAQPEAPPASEGPYFRLVEKRLWDVYENGGRLDGPSVICGEKHELFVNVIDANGSRLNGVRIDGLGNESHVTGDQGKGDGVVEFILWSGQEVRVGRDSDGREAQSDLAAGLTTNPGGISYEDLMQAKYCTDETSCRNFATPSNQPPGCLGHFSWTVTFQRNY